MESVKHLLDSDDYLSYTKRANGEAGVQGYVKQNEKKRKEADFFVAIDSGDLPFTRAGVKRWYEANGGWDYFNTDDFNGHINYIEKEAGRLGTEINNFMDLNSSQFEDDIDKQLFRIKAITLVHQMKYTADNEQLPGLLQNLVKNGNYESDSTWNELGLSSEYSQHDPQVRQALIEKHIQQGAFQNSEYNRWRAEQAIQLNIPMREVMTPDHQQWPGKGLMSKNGTLSYTIASTYKDYFEEAGNSYNVDPDLLAALAQVVSTGGERFAQSRLKPGAMGIMQLDREVATAMGLQNDQQMFDPRLNILGGARSMGEMLDQTDGDIWRAVGEYATGMLADEIPKFIKEVRRIYKKNWQQVDLSSLYPGRMYKLPTYDLSNEKQDIPPKPVPEYKASSSMKDQFINYMPNF